jgi:hypothetical protein
VQTIAHTFATTDPVYQAANPSAVNVRILDNDTAGVLVTESAGSTQVADRPDRRLHPASAVGSHRRRHHQLSSAMARPWSRQAISPAPAGTVAVTFTPTNWYIPQTVTVGLDPDFVPGSARVEQAVARGPHTVDQLLGPVIVEGGVAEGNDRSLLPPVLLPTEAAEAPIDIAIATDETQQTDRLNVFNDGSQADDTGSLTNATLDPNLNALITLSDAAMNLSGLGMAGSTTFDVSEAQDGSQPITVEGGITFDDIEVTEVLLGSGNDQFLVEATSTGTPGAADSVVTLIHGGGNTAVTDPVTGATVMGGDRITVTGGGGAASPLVVYGDTSQDGSRYNAASSSTQFNANGNAVVFDAFGNDIIDASASALSITAYGGPGNDTLYGSAEGDQLAGGSGDDVIAGNGGQDHIYGDSGFNLDSHGGH